MGKIDALMHAFEEMAECGERLAKAAYDVRDFLAEKQKLKPASKADPGAEAEPALPPAADAPKTYTFVEVRKAFSAKAHEGHTDEVRELIAKYGADRLSGVKEEDYAAIMAELESIQ